LSEPTVYWEDVAIGEKLRSGVTIATEEQILTFAQQFDPLPVHVDRAAAAASPFGTLTAPGTYMLALRVRLSHDFAFAGSLIAAVGLEEVRFRAPLRAGQTCQVENEFLEKRPSRSDATRGIVVIGSALLADGEPVLTLKDVVLMRRRPTSALER
jgi:acyl dehydratase